MTCWDSSTGLRRVPVLRWSTIQTETNPNSTVQSKANPKPIESQSKANPKASIRNLRVRHREEICPTSRGDMSDSERRDMSDIERSQARRREESCPTLSGALTDNRWDPGDRCHGYTRWRREKVVGERCRKVEIVGEVCRPSCIYVVLLM